MEILGVGFSEFVFILIIAIIFLGGKGMYNAGLTIGRWLNWFTKSEFGITMRDAVSAISNLPTKLMKDANIEEWKKELDVQNMIDGREQKTKYTSSWRSPLKIRGQKSRSSTARKSKPGRTEAKDNQTAEQDG